MLSPSARPFAKYCFARKHCRPRRSQEYGAGDRGISKADIMGKRGFFVLHDDDDDVNDYDIVIVEYLVSL